MTDEMDAGAAGMDEELAAVAGGGMSAAVGGRPAPQIRLARFGELADAGNPAASETLDLLMDVGLTVTVELGRTEMPVRDVLGLAPGAVIELRRPAADPVDIFVNNKVVARGEVVVVGDRFGVRITELISA